MRQLTALNTVLTYRFDKSQQLLNTASTAHMSQEIGAATELISPLRYSITGNGFCRLRIRPIHPWITMSCL